MSEKILNGSVLIDKNGTQVVIVDAQAREDIAANAQNIAQNTLKSERHETRITQAESNIAQNASAVQQNATNIAAHETRIAQTEADNQENTEAIRSLSEEIADIEEGIYSEKPIVETIRITDWERGGISSSTGEGNDDANLYRMRSGFVECKKGDVIAAPDAVTWLFPYFYTPESHELIGRVDTWVRSYTVTEDMAIRIVVRIAPSTSDQIGQIKLTDETISNYSIEFQRIYLEVEKYIDVVRYSTAQTLAEAEQRQACNNIGAAFVGSPTILSNWQRGNIASADGQDAETNITMRMRSDFVAVEKGNQLIFPENSYLFVYYYDPNTHAYLGNLGEWIESGYIVPENKTVRFVVKYANESTDKGEDISDEYIANYKLQVHRVSNEAALRIEQLPTLALKGDITGMTKDNAVTLNYSFLGQTGTCSVKWQGSSSVRYVKKNYTIKPDTGIDGWAKWAEFVNTQRAANGNISSIPTESRWGAQTKFCTKANWIDPSHARNVVCARLWGQMVKARIDNGEITDNRTLAPNYGAIDGFPIEITINGESMGLYTFNIPKDAWQFAMGNSATEYVLSAESNSQSACGWWTLAEVNEKDYSVEHADDSVSTDTIKNSLNAAIQAALDAGADWETTLAPYLDINSVFDYFIFAACINHRDGISHNALYGTYDGTKWFISAYDMDTVFGSDPYGTSWYTAGNTMKFSDIATKHKLAQLIYTHSKAKLKTRYKELRETVLSDENVWHVLSQFIVDISTRNYDVDRSIWPTMPGTATANMAQYMNYYHMHCALLDKEIEAMS